MIELSRDKVIAEVIERLEKGGKGGEAIYLEGNWGSFGAMLTAYIGGETGRPILYVRPHIDDADKACDDLTTFGAKDVEQFNAWEGAEDTPDATDEIRSERLRVTLKIHSGAEGVIVAAPAQALCQSIPKPEVLEKSNLHLEAGKNVPPEAVSAWLVDNGFEQVDRIDVAGQFAKRGGIIDIYAPVAKGKGGDGEKIAKGGRAIRVEFFGDEVESIRTIDLDTQRSVEDAGRIDIVPVICGVKEDERELFLNILPADTIIVLEEAGEIEEVTRVFFERSAETSRLYKWEEIYPVIEQYTRVYVSRFAGVQNEEYLRLPVRSVQQYSHGSAAQWTGHKEAMEEILAEARARKEVYFYCESAAEVKRIEEIIRSGGGEIPEKFRLVVGYINEGFSIESLGVIVISHHEVFGQYVIRRRQRPIRASVAVDTLSDLQEGDYVVHVSYGIGRYAGVETIEEKGTKGEYLTIEYADKVRVHVSVTNITLVQKYVGSSLKRPKLSKIGTKRWQKQKEKVAKSVEDMAVELLEIQARRKAAGGITYGPDSQWQAEFEESFPYVETADQITSMEEIKGDMEEAMSMDRLLCGDVGYGKTELAMRAAFKVVENSKQVVILVPTTVLSVQHGRTFTERFADFPVAIEVLNRFKTARQVKEIVAATKAGRVDILIGTHRLLSSDIGFKDLGLLIIDEEQRFGVEHKERLKRLRFDVDVLTMTATPIPRTLHMSLLGLRDISSLGTPPLDRRSVVTRVATYSDEMIKRAIMDEMNRGGQVFYVHNRVKTIEKKAVEIGKLVSGARIVVAHGQMAKSELERAMIDFVSGKADILVCTTIIESGLDIPNANTILIDDADRFGLAELHQLRGRVGRYKHRAYAYIMLPKNRSITPTAARRLKAIEEYSHLGAGFRIALRDLEIRGAGNILGVEQSGHIQMVGYQMYCELLSQAVHRLRNEPIEELASTVIELGATTYIPKNYIPVDRERMEAYRKIAVAKDVEDLAGIKEELADIYGEVPNEVEMLLEIAKLRIAAWKRSIKSIVISGQELIIVFKKEGLTQNKEMFSKIGGAVTLRVADGETVRLRMPKNYLETGTLLSFLRKILK